jgi:hypothetical protein
MDATWNSLKLLDTEGKSNGKFSSTDDALTDERPDEISRSPDGCKGLELHYLEFCTESS